MKEILRNEKIIEESVMLTHNSETSTYVLGVQLEQQKMNFLEKVDISIRIFVNYFKMTFDGLKMMITGKVSANDIYCSCVEWNSGCCDKYYACKKHGGFYLGSIGGPAAILAKDNIKSVKCLEYPELGMEAIWQIEVENFPAFILVDDKGNDFFSQLRK